MKVISFLIFILMFASNAGAEGGGSVITLHYLMIQNGNSEMNDAFTRNGLEQPKNPNAGFDFEYYRRIDASWRLGFQIWYYSTQQKLGALSGYYYSNHFAIDGAYEFMTGTFVPYFGAGIGISSAEFTLFGSTQSGQIKQGYFTFRPSLGIDFYVNPGFCFGAKVSPQITWKQSHDISGSNVLVDHLVPSGQVAYSLGIGFSF